MFGEVIYDSSIISNGYIEREGFLFTSLTYPANVYDALIFDNVDQKDNCFRRFPKSKRSLIEHVQFVNENNIEKIVVFTSDLYFIKDIPAVKYISIELYADKKDVDFLPLYSLPEIKSLVITQSDFDGLKTPVDYSKIKGLVDIGISGRGHLNYEKIKTLKSLSISNIKQENLRSIFSSDNLDTLQIISSGISSLEGIEQSKKLQCLYLHYNRKLQDISFLTNVKESLRALRIENCPKITDFSVLERLENLELLELSGSNALSDLKFIRKLKKLKTFTFSMEILDGDITPCSDLSYVYSEKNRKYYNLKDKDLPKGDYVRGNEDIEIWRRRE